MSGARPPAISAAGLHKSFGKTAVLDGVDFTVAEGTIFALLGPNGGVRMLRPGRSLLA